MTREPRWPVITLVPNADQIATLHLGLYGPSWSLAQWSGALTRETGGVWAFSIKGFIPEDAEFLVDLGSEVSLESEPPKAVALVRGDELDDAPDVGQLFPLYGIVTAISVSDDPSEFLVSIDGDVSTGRRSARTPAQTTRPDLAAVERTTSAAIRLHSILIAMQLADRIIDSGEEDATWAAMLRPGLARLYEAVERNNLPPTDQRTLRQQLSDTAQRIERLESLTTAVKTLAGYVLGALAHFA
jgi:hypothetical protein